MQDKTGTIEAGDMTFSRLVWRSGHMLRKDEDSLVYLRHSFMTKAFHMSFPVRGNNLRIEIYPQRIVPAIIQCTGPAK